MTLSADASATRYEPITQIGRGGMAEVMLAMMDAGGGARRLVVLKRIWPELATDPDFVTMFLDEARLCLRLNHANVVQTYEVLTGDTDLAIAMEYLDGQPLTRVLNRLRGPGQLSVPLRLRILTRVLAGLEHAHTLTDLDGTALEVVHRDVSPHNVFVTYDGQVKLVDFGVAKTLAASHHTRPGALKGKLAYMAPEQLQRTVIDRRADVFAVGVMLWEMLAGRRMWHGMTEVEIVAHLASGLPLPPLPSEGSSPAGLDAICARALDPDPDRRYQTAADLELDLEGALAGSADSHARNLGKVVSLAFEAERAERRAIIERSLRQSAPVMSVVPAAAVPATDDLPLSELAGEPSVHHAPTGTPPAGAPWLRRAAVGGLFAVAGAILLAGGWHRSAMDGHAAQRVATGAAVVLAPAPPQPQSATVAESAVPDQTPRPRRRHRAAPLDEDATLPLSPELVAPELADPPPPSDRTSPP